jgi:hypothetical protein
MLADHVALGHKLRFTPTGTTMTEESLRTFLSYWPLWVPLVLVQIGLIVYALLDWTRRGSLRGSRWLWLVVILFLNIVGPVLYLLVGREEE